MNQHSLRRWLLFCVCLLLIAAVVFLSLAPKSDHAVVETSGSARTRAQNAAVLSIVGQVTDAAGASIASARVCGRLKDEANAFDDVCANSVDGRYALQLRSGNYRVTASATGYASRSELIALKNSRALDFSLSPAKSNVAGIVRSGAGAPIAGARVTVLTDGKPFADSTSDERGEFSTYAQAGPVVVTAIADGFAAAVARTVAPSSDLSIVLQAGGRISGTIRHQNSNEVLAGVRVHASRRAFVANSASEQSTRSDANGRFEFTSLSPGPWFLMVGEERLLTQAPVPIEIDPAQSSPDVTLFVQDGVELTGRLLLEEKPCPRGRLQLLKEAKPTAAAATSSRKDNSMETAAIANSNEEGRVVVPALASGQYSVLAQCEESVLVSGPSTVSVADNDVADSIWKFAVRSTVDVRVVDTANRPIVEAVLALIPLDVVEKDAPVVARRAIADREGAHRFGGLTPGRYELRAKPGGISGMREVSQTIQVGTDANAVNVVLPAIGDIEIETRDAKGAASSKLLFYAQGEGDARYEAFYVGEGRYRIFPLPNGSYRVWAYDNKNAKKIVVNGSSQVVAIENSKTIKLRHTYVRNDGVLHGRVVDTSGKGIPNIPVRAVNMALTGEDEFFSGVQRAAQGDQSAATDHAGRFQIDDLDERELFRVIAQAGDEPALRENVRPGEDIELRLQR